MRLGKGRMVERGGLMRKLMRRERLRMLRLKVERVGVLEVVVSAQSVRIEALEVRIRRGLASVDGAFRSGEGEGRA